MIWSDLTPPRLQVRSVEIDDPGTLLERLPPADAHAWIRRGEGIIGYGEVVRNRVFMAVVALNFVFIGAGMAQLEAGLQVLGVRYVASRGNFVLAEVGDAGAVNASLLAQGVIVRPVANCGLPSWLRITVGLPEENTRFLTALTKALRG